MTLIKGKRESITILDFSSGNVSKNKIKESLRNLRLKDTCAHDSKTLTIFDNYIKVGMYDIRLNLQEDYEAHSSLKRLREYGGFQISISELGKEININKDRRFKSQYWVKENVKNRIRCSNLVDAIFYCSRLNNLRLFL